MFTKFRPRSVYDVMAALSLFIVLGGTSYAVATNSIGSAQIKNSSVRSKDIRNNQVSSADVRNASLLASDFRTGQLPAGERGPRGDRGDTGPTGATGAPGAPGTTNVTTRFSFSPFSGGISVNCPAGQKAIGGGGFAPGSNNYLFSSRPTPVVSEELRTATPTGWEAQARSNVPGEQATGTTVYVICASP